MKQTLIGLIFIACIAGSAVAYGFFLIGSPLNQRKAHLDQRKIEYLSNVADQVSAYYRLHEQLPRSLSEVDLDPQLARSLSLGQSEPTYVPAQDGIFQLCLTFETEKKGMKKAVYENFYNLLDAPHRAGVECYSFKITQTK